MMLFVIRKIQYKTLDELDIVSNQNISMEMFLIRLLYLQEHKIDDSQEKVNLNNEKYFP